MSKLTPLEIAANKSRKESAFKKDYKDSYNYYMDDVIAGHYGIKKLKDIALKDAKDCVIGKPLSDERIKELIKDIKLDSPDTFKARKKVTIKTKEELKVTLISSYITEEDFDTYKSKHKIEHYTGLYKKLPFIITKSICIDINPIGAYKPEYEYSTPWTLGGSTISWDETIEQLKRKINEKIKYMEIK